VVVSFAWYRDCFVVAARAHVNAVNAAAPSGRSRDDLLEEMLENQFITEPDMHIYQTPRRQQQQQQQQQQQVQVASLR